MRCPHVSPGRALRVRSWAFDHAGRACSTFSFPRKMGTGVVFTVPAWFFADGRKGGVRIPVPRGAKICFDRSSEP